MSLLRLGNLLRERRGGRGVREVAKEIGVSPATLSRVEGGKLPDLLTFRRLCAWLKVDPADVLEISPERESAAGAAPVAAVHLRADSLLSEGAAADLALLILAAHRELIRRARGQQEDVSAWL
jgi:transcriptional regulator with XRE-family HTH domain